MEVSIERRNKNDNIKFVYNTIDIFAILEEKQVIQVRIVNNPVSYRQVFLNREEVYIKIFPEETILIPIKNNIVYPVEYSLVLESHELFMKSHLDLVFNHLIEDDGEQYIVVRNMSNQVKIITNGDYLATAHFIKIEPIEIIEDTDEEKENK